MKAYNTYQEAKIDNPNSEIYEREDGVFATESLHREPCNPKDYCISLESFLASGKRLVQGDVYIETSGQVSRVGRTTEAVNKPHQTDRTRYILKAKALENPAHEWANGDEWDGTGLPPVGVECEILFKEYQNKGFGLFSVLAYSGGYVWVQYIGPLSNNGKCYTAECSTLEFRKQETPEKKLEREELEAACDLWEKIKSDDDSDWSDMPISFQWYILAAVKTTGYRKETKS